MDESLGNVVCDGVFWLFVEHEDEQLSFLGKLLVLANVVELGHQLPIFVLILVQNTLHRHIDRLAVLLQIVLHLLLELCSTFFSFRADYGMPKATIGLIIFVELLKFLLVEVYEFRGFGFFHPDIDFWINSNVPSLAIVKF